ncbi:hypothetical protein LTR17_013532 [Elasticomyces elasticus]|nr:hypothetical protein LTR17_013532 [Elasticomyces elasticus]
MHPLPRCQSDHDAAAPIPPCQPSRAWSFPSTPEVSISITNENWRGKSDRTERRRIQNRLNQRAYRERHRKTPPRDEFVLVKSESDPEESFFARQMTAPPTSSPWQAASAAASGSPAPSKSFLDETPSSTFAEAQPFKQESLEQIIGEPDRDELGATINRNVMQAATENAQSLGIEIAAVRYGIRALTDQSLQAYDMPASLAPLQLQYCIPHDQLIDIIPHCRFRYNVLEALAARRLDVESLTRSIRRSGLIVSVQGRRGRDGLVAWGRPDDFRDWEISEAFYLVWREFLEGCEDWIESTNNWRRSRGEAEW